MYACTCNNCTCVLMNLFQNHVALWNGKKLEVYVISQDKSSVRDAGKCHCNSTIQSSVQYMYMYMYNNGTIIFPTSSDFVIFSH